MRIFLPVLLLLLAATLIAVYKLPSYSHTYFRTPLNISLQLAANFGELREDHFHMGLDIRTMGREDLPVYAAAAGYISHVKIAPYGLGQALCITHPNGRTTVYGHLDHFTPELAALVRGWQYAGESWEQERDLASHLFPVEKGQLIAYSGNTGSSQAPHLHFEVRDTRSGKNINPLLTDLRIPDDIAPVIKGLYWYDRRYSTYRTRARKIPLSSKDGVSRTVQNIVRLNSPLVSLGIVATDRASNSPHLSGIFSAKLWFDGQLIHGFQLGELADTDSRYINACIDYPKWVRSGIYVQHLSILPGNHLAIFAPAGNDGIIRLTDSGMHHVQIRVSDVYNNYSDLDFRVQLVSAGQAGAGELPVSSDGQNEEQDKIGEQGGGKRITYLLSPGRENTVKDRNVRLRFQATAFYDQAPFVLYEANNPGSNKASMLVHLHDPSLPVHNRYVVQVRTTLAPGSPLRGKTVMQLVSGDSQLVIKGVWQGDWMSGSFNRLGDVQLLVDTMAPVVQASGWMEGQVFSSDARYLQLVCKDELGMVARFRAELDGHWILFEQKRMVFRYAFDEHCPAGRHQLLVTVSDVAGNETRKLFSFLKG